MLRKPIITKKYWENTRFPHGQLFNSYHREYRERTMDSTTFTLHDGPRIINETLTPGKNLLELIQMIPSVHVDAPCGGKGTCGKCRILILDGKVSEPTGQERKYLSSDEIESGVRLACMTYPEGSVTVSMESVSQTARIQTSDGLPFKGVRNPLFTKKNLNLSPAHLEDQKSLESRLLESLPSGTTLPHRLRSVLADLQYRECYSLSITLCGEEITKIEEQGQSEGLYALAVDIGTTTIVAYLVNLLSGRVIGSVAGLNTQKSFGADVISRIEYIGDDPEKLSQLQQKIIVQIESLAIGLMEKSGIGENELCAVYAAGNTTMMHIIQGLNPRTIARAPFIPVSTESMILTPSDIGSSLPENLRFVMLPSLSGYIGADIIAGILSTGMAESEDLSLLVDIGTNGEIALGNREKLISCSTAAGPAFEGANIMCGVGGVPGAVSSFKAEGAGFSWETIENKPPSGICGSGIIDLTAYLLQSGLADYTGRLQDESDWGDTPPPQSDFLKEEEGEMRFVWGEEHKTIFFGQKDLREVQLAKGAIAAGIITLVKETGSSLGDIKNVYLAGGFGSYLDHENALAIGLLPEELRGKITSVGNSCGAGVLRCALSKDEMQKGEIIKKRIKYIELSSSKGFQDEYMMNMYFPEY